MRFAILSFMVILAGCAQLDDRTGTTFEQRCAGYRSTLAVQEAIFEERSETMGGKERRARVTSLAALRALVAACP